MLNFMAGASRPAHNGARAAQIKSVTDLVQRTLAQHGLSGPAGGAESPFTAPQMPDLTSLMARLKPASGATPARNVTIPTGAAFRSDTFTNDAGSRSFRTYVPSTAKDGVTGLLVMLHGCTQTAEDFAIGTDMNALAEKHRFVVVYPQQSRGENAQSCWNWFRRGDQMHGRGEPAILAGIATQVSSEFKLTKDKVFVAGLSAGGAMAVILGETYPDVFSAVGSHSGLPFAAAKDVLSAFEAMAGRGESETPTNAGAVRTITFHGSADATVHPVNSQQIGRHVLDRSASTTIERDETHQSPGRAAKAVTTSDLNGNVLLETWTIDGLGHAWSGGHPDGSYTDTNGPVASTEMVRFFFEHEERAG